jgi:hypothetical protein
MPGYKKRNLTYGCMGNGASVYDRANEVGGDFEKVAFISPEREVKIYARVSPADKALIEKWAREDDPRCSATQPGYVFKNRPEVK